MADLVPAVQMDSLVRTPPARPAAPRELLAGPGQPRALEHRPEQSPGRIPVPAAPVQNSDAVETLEDIEAHKEASVDYQILKSLMAAQGRRFGEVSSDDDREPPAASAGIGNPNAADRPAAAVVAASGAGAGSAVEVTRLDAQRLEISVTGDRIEINVETLTYERIALKQAPPPVQKSDPLALDLDGNGLQTTGVEQGIAFDIDGDGVTDHTSFVTGGDAFLALDRDGNGTIDSGRELFGDQNGAANGFLELGSYDDNRDRRIDMEDAVYSDLRLLRIDDDGRQSLLSLADAGVRSIDLNYRNTQQALNDYDSIAQLGSFERDDGSAGTAGDLILGFRSLA